MYRQGDILLVKANAPTDYEQRSAKRAVLGYGEANGHTHTMDNVTWVVAPETTDADLHEFALGEKLMPVFVVADEDTELRHQEHGPITVPPGTWRVIRQREYTPQRIVSVVD